MNKNPENMINLKNDVDGIQKAKTKPNYLTLFCLNTCSLKKILLTENVLLKLQIRHSISESRIKSNMNITTKNNLPKSRVRFFNSFLTLE